VEGVTAEQWLLGRTALAQAKGRMPPPVLERAMTAYGVPAGRWAAVDAGWMARAEADPHLDARRAAADGT